MSSSSDRTVDQHLPEEDRTTTNAPRWQSRYRPAMEDWALIAVAAAILVVVVVREIVRWRGRRWRR